MRLQRPHNQFFPMITQTQPAVLVYYSYRGMAHPIRSFLRYLEVPHYQVHLDRLDEQAGDIPEQVISKVRELKIDEQRLPALLHESHQLWTTFAIAEYLCIRFCREELLGENMQKRAIVEQILELYRVLEFEMKPEGMKELGRIIEFPEDVFLERLEQLFLKMYFKIDPSCHVQNYLGCNPHSTQSSFILGTLTVADFLFHDNIYYLLGTFGALCPQISNSEWKSKPMSYRAGPATMQALIKLRSFSDHFQSQAWYQEHKDVLEKYPILGALTTQEQREGVKKAWAGDMSVLR